MSKKSSSTTGPSKFAQPYITSGANAVQSAFQGNQGNISAITKTLQDHMGGVVDATLNNPTLGAANAYTQQTLASDPASNPFLQKQIDLTNSDVANKVNASIGTRGGAGGSAQAQLLARELANNESTLRYGDYTAGVANKNAAVGQATAESAAQNGNISALLSYLTGQAQIPQSSANSYASALAGLLGNSQTTTQSNPLLPQLLNAGAQAGSAAIMASDRRLKRDIERVGELHDALPVYEYEYVWGGGRTRGVMADEVAELRPWALGPRIGGYATVNYDHIGAL